MKIGMLCAVLLCTGCQAESAMPVGNTYSTALGMRDNCRAELPARTTYCRAYILGVLDAKGIHCEKTSASDAVTLVREYVTQTQDITHRNADVLIVQGAEAMLDPECHQ